MEQRFQGQSIALNQAIGALKAFADNTVEEQFKATLKAEEAIAKSEKKNGLLSYKEACTYIGKSTRVLNRLMELGLDVYMLKGSARGYYFLPADLDKGMKDYKTPKQRKRK